MSQSAFHLSTHIQVLISWIILLKCDLNYVKAFSAILLVGTASFRKYNYFSFHNCNGICTQIHYKYWKCKHFTCRFWFHISRPATSWNEIVFGNRLSELSSSFTSTFLLNTRVRLCKKVCCCPNFGRHSEKVSNFADFLVHSLFCCTLYLCVYEWTVAMCNVNSLNPWQPLLSAFFVFLLNFFFIFYSLYGCVPILFFFGVLY